MLSGGDALSELFNRVTRVRLQWGHDGVVVEYALISGETGFEATLLQWGHDGVVVEY